MLFTIGTHSPEENMNKTHYYNLVPPPRYVPWPIRGQVFFGGFYNQFGWLWFGFSLIFVWAFGSNTSLNDVYFALRSTETASAVISTVESTGASENDTPVYANHYTFRVEKLETEFQGISYTTGRQYNPGQSVTVEYLGSNPNASRILGARGGTFSPWVLCLVGLFPLIGLAFLSAGVRQGVRGNYLLAHGKVGLGTLIAKESTNVTINEQPVYKLTFEFTADDGQNYQATAKSHLPHVLEDEAQEQLVYHPRRPTYAVMLDSLPGQPDIDEFGNVQVAHFGRTIIVLILPALVLMGHGTYFLYTLL